MHLQSILSTAALIALASALPLNINLGAYSPAIVVGDGAIEFEGGEGVENIINSLEGAAVTGAASRVGEGAAAPPQESVNSGLEVVQAQVAPTPILTEPAGFPIPGAGAKELDPRISSSTKEAPAQAKRDLAGFDRALKFAEAALTKGPKIELGTGAEGSGVGIIVDNHAGAEASAEGVTRANNGIVVE